MTRLVRSERRRSCLSPSKVTIRVERISFGVLVLQELINRHRILDSFFKPSNDRELKLQLTGPTEMDGSGPDVLTGSISPVKIGPELNEIDRDETMLANFVL